ncbi:hypothetical protein R1flu_005522 [Riccia fluitans]|uniref:Uncharacterized protein n=1 Tax=Riccia fluitans TaxID=41844 RepID=A0ABD1YU23_9MARC
MISLGGVTRRSTQDLSSAASVASRIRLFSDRLIPGSFPHDYMWWLVSYFQLLLPWVRVSPASSFVHVDRPGTPLATRPLFRFSLHVHVGLVGRPRWLLSPGFACFRNSQIHSVGYVHNLVFSSIRPSTILAFLDFADIE